MSFNAMNAATVVSADVITTLINPANGHTYHLLTQNNWTNSQAEAVSLGGNLATVNDSAENAWIYAAFSSFDGVQRNLWIGLNDAATEDNFVWVSGESPTYSNWYGAEPDNDGGNQDYGFIINDNYSTTSPAYQPPYNRRWGDVGDVAVVGTLPIHGVVEAIPEPSSVLLLLAGVAGMSLSRSRRRS